MTPEQAADAIIDDLRGRHSLSDAFESVDQNTYLEIRAAWIAIIRKVK